MKTLLCLLTISLVMAPIGARQEPGKETPMQNGLQITLKPGQAVPDQLEEPKKPVPTEALDGKSTQTILQGLPAFEHAAQQTEFALRPSSSPPPSV